MNIFRKIAKLLAKIILILAIAFLFLWIKEKNDLRVKLKQFTQSEQEEIVREKSIPDPQDPKTITFQWMYGKKKYELTETLYRSIYDFYASEPKQFTYQDSLPPNWEEEYFSMFLRPFSGDKTIAVIARNLQALGKKNKLSDDQLVDFTLAFVQAIPYDSAKAEKILADSENKTGGLTNYPYETLYQNAGVCSDKSFLATKLLRELGYGTALFVYKNENHMAVGVKCPVEYSSYGSGYCFAETTAAGSKIGMIPELNSRNNQAEQIREISYFDKAQSDQFDTKNLGSAEIYQQSEGKEYLGIIATIKTARALEGLGVEIRTSHRELTMQKNKISEKQSELQDLQKRMDKFAETEDIRNFNKLVPRYNDLAEDISREIKKYNKNTDIYNKKVMEYNQLAKNF